MSTSIRNHGQVIKIAGAWIVVAALAVVTGIGATSGFIEPSKSVKFRVLLAVLWLLFAAGFLLLRTAPVRKAVVVIVAASLAIGGAAMLGTPTTSTDSARYAWDGIVQNAGISPYTYAADDAALAPLRPEWLFPTPIEGADGSLSCPRDFSEPPSHLLTDTSGTKICSVINRTGVHTIYPPTSELLFVLMRTPVPASAAYWPMQLVGLLMSVGITLLLLVGLRRWGLDPRWAALWALCPMVANDGITNAHVDQLGALLALAGVFAVAAGARWRGGILLGAAIAAKLIPALTVPAVLRHQPAKVTVAAVATFAVLYVPYVATTGLGVIGFLPGYLTEEGYSDGSRFTLLFFLPGPVALVVAAVLLLALAAVVIRLSDPSRPWLGQVLMIGGTLILVSPRYSWYGLLLIPFVAMSGRWEWMLVPLALAIHKLYAPPGALRVSLLITIAVIVAVSILRDLRDPDGRIGTGLLRRPRKLVAGDPRTTSDV